MDRYTAYDMAARMGFEGVTFHTEPTVFANDDGTETRDEISHVYISLEEEVAVEDGEESQRAVSEWYACTTKTNGCEVFTAWTPDIEAFRAECRAASKKAKRRSRRGAA